MNGTPAQPITSHVPQIPNSRPAGTARLLRTCSSVLRQIHCPSFPLPAERRDLIDRLSRDFGNLREVCQSGDIATKAALFDPVLDRFRESLDVLAAAPPELETKCADLDERLGRFLEPPRAADASNADGPNCASDEDALPF
jgi:hypothetical protein